MKRMTIDGLATKVEHLTTMIDDLAVMVQQGFQGFKQRVNQRFSGVEECLDRIELRLDQCAYRFELVELQHRAGTIERQMGLGK